jgi:hypothetical protein
MAEDNVGSAPKPSWHEREINLALQRLANARAHLALLEEQAGASTPAAPVVDPADLARADELQRDIAKLTAKASGRFGGGSARKLQEAERELRLLLHRVGVERVEDLRAAPGDAGEAVDPAVLDFARRECDDAQKAFLEVTAMVIPEAEDEPEAPDAEVIPAASSFTDEDLDLRDRPAASRPAAS